MSPNAYRLETKKTLRPSGIKLTYLARKWTLNEDVLPIKHGDIPASYVGLLEGIQEHCFIPMFSFTRFFVVLTVFLFFQF